MWTVLPFLLLSSFLPSSLGLVARPINKTLLGYGLTYRSLRHPQFPPLAVRFIDSTLFIPPLAVFHSLCIYESFSQIALLTYICALPAEIPPRFSLTIAHVRLVWKKKSRG